MKDYSKLIKMLDSEIDVIEGRERLDMNTLEIADKVIHTLKNIYKIRDYHETHCSKDGSILVHEDTHEERKSWEELPSEEKDLRWYNKMMNEAKTEEERTLITKLMNLRSE